MKISLYLLLTTSLFFTAQLSIAMSIPELSQKFQRIRIDDIPYSSAWDQILSDLHEKVRNSKNSSLISFDQALTMFDLKFKEVKDQITMFAQLSVEERQKVLMSLVTQQNNVNRALSKQPGFGQKVKGFCMKNKDQISGLKTILEWVFGRLNAKLALLEKVNHELKAEGIAKDMKSWNIWNKSVAGS
jgi:hypothetical protein